ncbi:MAG: DPP IV N-terminal domain-containing protein, partial [Rubripirellula sp.]|nr:DPP IV N-terminal domain-containing protein [Rubripirellula sp.]
IDRIYQSDEFNGRSFTGRWLENSDSPAFTMIEAGGIVRVDAESGDKSVMVSKRELTPGGLSPLAIQSYALSNDHNLVLIYTNSKRVWRSNTRGDYWVLDRTSGQLTKLGGDAPPATLMFAKFSPSNRHVAYVRDGDIYLEDCRNHKITRLTTAENEFVINGTTDWVYEEELGLRDAFRFSPDGKTIAYWQINTEGVPQFPLINNLDSLYPEVRYFAYPKVGQTNPSCRVCVVDCGTGVSTMIGIPGDPREHYLPKMDFVPRDAFGTGDQQPRLLIQQLNRLQNTNRLYLADFLSKTVSEVFVERDDAWIDVNDESIWLKNGRQFTWMSDRTGWRHLYLASLDTGEVQAVTRGDFDVIQLLEVDDENQLAYFIASPESATQRYLYRVNLDGTELQRVTPASGPSVPGTHAYSVSPDGSLAIHTRSSADQPPVVNLIRLADHFPLRRLEDNQKLAKTFGELDHTNTEFFRVTVEDGVELDGWCIKPPNMKADQKYPLLVYVYGEPAGSTVVNRWGGKSYLWHLMLAQQGYVVMSFDNRGTKAPRGREFRKSIYKKIGILPPADQAAAVRAVLKERPYLDAERVGIWGWSGGGSSSLHAVFKHPDLYKMAIAIAPVPNQRYYDTIYQERYMSLPHLNVEGFYQGSPIHFAKHLKGSLLLVHGTDDDNCHVATTEMLVDELVAHDKQFDLMLYPGRTHSIRERTNTTRHLRRMMTDYVLDNL